jgi:hypothetical protein
MTFWIIVGIIVVVALILFLGGSLYRFKINMGLLSKVDNFYPSKIYYKNIFGSILAMDFRSQLIVWIPIATALVWSMKDIKNIELIECTSTTFLKINFNKGDPIEGYTGLSIELPLKHNEDLRKVINQINSIRNKD